MAFGFTVFLGEDGALKLHIGNENGVQDLNSEELEAAVNKTDPKYLAFLGSEFEDQSNRFFQASASILAKTNPTFKNLLDNIAQVLEEDLEQRPLGFDPHTN